MQTFLPYDTFSMSAKCLDNRRLGKQRVEVLQILTALTDESYGWQNHPAVKMWRRYERALIHYGVHVCGAWTDRGFKDNTLDKIRSFIEYGCDCEYPHWLGGRIHTTHRAALLYKDPVWYGQCMWVEEPKLDYYWPVD